MKSQKNISGWKVFICWENIRKIANLLVFLIKIFLNVARSYHYYHLGAWDLLLAGQADLELPPFVNGNIN